VVRCEGKLGGHRRAEGRPSIVSLGRSSGEGRDIKRREIKRRKWKIENVKRGEQREDAAGKGKGGRC